MLMLTVMPCVTVPLLVFSFNTVTRYQVGLVRQVATRGPPLLKGGQVPSSGCQKMPFRNPRGTASRPLTPFWSLNAGMSSPESSQGLIYPAGYGVLSDRCNWD